MAAPGLICSTWALPPLAAASSGDTEPALSVGLPSGGCCSPVLHTGKLQATSWAQESPPASTHPPSGLVPCMLGTSVLPSQAVLLSWGSILLPGVYWPRCQETLLLVTNGGPPGISWVEANDAAKHCTPTIKNDPASDAKNAKVRNLISAAGWRPWQHPKGSQQNIPGDSVCFPKTLFSLLKSFFLLLPGNVFIIQCHCAKCLHCLMISQIQLSYMLVAAEQIRNGGEWEIAVGKKKDKYSNT